MNDDDEELFAGLYNGTGAQVSADLTIENLVAAADEIKRRIPKPPRVARHEGRVYIVVDDVWYQFPEGTTYEHALSVLSEAMFLAEQRWNGDRGQS